MKRLRKLFCKHKTEYNFGIPIGQCNSFVFCNICEKVIEKHGILTKKEIKYAIQESKKLKYSPRTAVVLYD